MICLTFVFQFSRKIAMVGSVNLVQDCQMDDIVEPCLHCSRWHSTVKDRKVDGRVNTGDELAVSIKRKFHAVMLQ